MKIFLLSIVILIAACQKENVAELSSISCEYDSRKTVEVIKNVEAVIEITPSFTFINQKNDDSKRYVACNLSNDIKNGQKIVFSAEIKEIFPNERWAGTPIKLTLLTTK
jgi:hypothetical protein